MAKFLAMAARAAEAEFSTIPRSRACRPRCASAASGRGLMVRVLRDDAKLRQAERIDFKEIKIFSVLLVAIRSTCSCINRHIISNRSFGNDNASSMLGIMPWVPFHSRGNDNFRVFCNKILSSWSTSDRIFKRLHSNIQKTC